MAKKTLYPLTEPMFCVLLCFHRRNMCGTEIAEHVRGITGDRVHLGPGTLYAMLSIFQTEKGIEKIRSEGRMITYSITEKGEELYQEELARLKTCINDAYGDVEI